MATDPTPDGGLLAELDALSAPELAVLTRALDTLVTLLATAARAERGLARRDQVMPPAYHAGRADAYNEVAAVLRGLLRHVR